FNFPIDSFAHLVSFSYSFLFPKQKSRPFSQNSFLRVRDEAISPPDTSQANHKGQLHRTYPEKVGKGRVSEQLAPPWDVNPPIKSEDSIYRRMSLTAPRNKITPSNEAASIAPAVKSD